MKIRNPDFIGLKAYMHSFYKTRFKAIHSELYEEVSDFKIIRKLALKEIQKGILKFRLQV